MSSRAPIQAHLDPPEWKTQAAIVAALKLALPRAIVAHVPNGGRRDPREAKFLVHQGVLAGFADLIILRDGRAYLMEVKTPKGRASEDQVSFRASCEREDIPYAIVRSVGEALDQLAEWGLKTRATVRDKGRADSNQAPGF